jgi:lysophospholipase L1-like esterase
MDAIRYVAIGDSFTEGVGDELPDGSVRGWADLVAQGLADAGRVPIQYANFAIRGRLAWPIVHEQLEPALALMPTHLSFNGGGNDMLRPRTPLSDIVDAFSHVLRRCDEQGVRFILLSGGDPSAGLPGGGLVKRRGDSLARLVDQRFADRTDIIRALNWPDRVLATGSFWSHDRLHMNASGHHRVAARVLSALGAEAPAEWWAMIDQEAPDEVRRIDFYREHFAPWVRRRLARSSSGDGRDPKYPEWITVGPMSGAEALD